MTTIARGNTAEIYCPLSTSVTFTPGSGGAMRLGFAVRSGDAAIAPQYIQEAATVSISAGSTVFAEAIGADATHTTPTGGDTALQSLVSGARIPQSETVLPDEVVRLTASGGVCGAPCYVSRIRCVTGTAVALTVYEGAASTATTLLTATLSAGGEATIPGGRLRAINGVRAVFASGSFDFHIGTEG